MHFIPPPIDCFRCTNWNGLDLEILFISEEDGRESLVDLTRTLCEMAQRGKISVGDVTQDLIDAEVSGIHQTLTN